MILNMPAMETINGIRAQAPELRKRYGLMINTVLVIDDNALDNAVLRNFLYNEHLNLVSALNGREALDILEGRNIDVIILDMVMPVMDGLTFLSEFKKTNYYRAIPIIVTTHNKAEDMIEKVIGEYEVFDYVIKPLDNMNKLILINRIKAAIRYRNAIKELQALKSRTREGGK